MRVLLLAAGQIASGSIGNTRAQTQCTWTGLGWARGEARKTLATYISQAMLWHGVSSILGCAYLKFLKTQSTITSYIYFAS